MEINELRRSAVREEIIPLDVESELYKEKLKLASEAYQVLGYGKYSHELTGRSEGATSKQVATAKAAKAFKKLGIQPLNYKDVVRYKDELLGKLNAEHAIRNFFNGDTGENLMIACAVIGVISGLLCFFGTLLWMDSHHPQVPHIMRYLVIFPIAFLLAWWTMAAIRGFTDHRMYLYSWQSNRIPNYFEAIPEFALSHAIALRKELGPDADFCVENLQRTVVDKTPLPADPFLILKLGGEAFYIVWEEDTFEARKIV